jgi:ElaA protein
MIEVREATSDELAACHAVRRVVFIEGQGVPAEIEVDGRDPSCRHVIAQRDGEVVGTARLRQVGSKAKAERVAVLESERGRGTGAAVMRALEQLAREDGFGRLDLHAQEAVVPFYVRIGYTAFGERFFEADIPHFAMFKSLT